MNILIIDDHPIFREGLRQLLKALDESVAIFQAADYDQALQQASEHSDLDLVLLDLNLPGKDGFITLASLASQCPLLPVVVVSGSSDRSDIQRSLEMGAVGYIPKNTGSAVMINALRLVLSGGIYIPQELAQQATTSLDREGVPDLTPRQHQILALLIQGYSNKAIAKQIQLAETTVKMHVTSIFKALGVTNRTQAVMAAEKLGLGPS